MRFSPDRMELVEGSARIVTLDLSAIKGANTITDADFTSDPTGITIGTPTISGGNVSAVVSGGDGGTNYWLILTATLSNGETDVGAIQLRWKRPTDTDSAGA